MTKEGHKCETCIGRCEVSVKIHATGMIYICELLKGHSGKHSETITW